MISQRLFGDIILVCVTFFWGLTFPLIENAMKVVNPSVFVTLRFLFAALILLPFLWRDFKHLLDKKLVIPGLILGAINVVVYNTQSIGLETISGGQSAFITGSCVIMVPFLLPLFRMGSPTQLDIISSFFCLIGLALLTGADISSMKVGCLWTLLCALAVALSIIYLQKITQKSISLNILAFYQILFTGILSAPLSIGKNYTSIFQADALIALGFCAIFATSISLLLQTKYQRFTTASRAVMIFSLEPLFASIFGYLINGETMGLLALLGGILIMMSLIIPEVYRSLREGKWLLNFFY